MTTVFFFLFLKAKDDNSYCREMINKINKTLLYGYAQAQPIIEMTSNLYNGQNFLIIEKKKNFLILFVIDNPYTQHEDESRPDCRQRPMAYPTLAQGKTIPN